MNLYLCSVGFVVWLFFSTFSRRILEIYVFFCEVVFMKCGICFIWWSCSLFHIFKNIFAIITSDLWCFWRFGFWFLWFFFVLRKYTTHVTCVVFQMKKWKWLEVRNKNNLFLEWFFFKVFIFVLLSW
jgi:hypothetical protein